MEGLQCIDLRKTVRAKIYGNNLGTVTNIIETLSSLQTSYYAFILFRTAIDEPKFGKDFEYSGFIRKINNLAEHQELMIHHFSDLSSYILPKEELLITRINFNSPGFWEVVGSLNPFLQLREYLNDRHNRKKDRTLWESEAAKAALENRKLELELQRMAIENYQLELKSQELALHNSEYAIEISLKKLNLAKETFLMLKKEGCSEIQLRQFTKSCINIFSELEKAVDNDRITGIEILEES